MIVVLFLASLVLARVDLGDPSHSIKDRYPDDGKISGWINLSLTDQRADAVVRGRLHEFATNVRGRRSEKLTWDVSMSLLDFLGKSGLSLAHYHCHPPGCDDSESIDWNSSNASKSFNLRRGESKIYAFAIKTNSGTKITKITNLSLDFNASPFDAHNHTFPQFEIDVLYDGKPEWESRHVTTFPLRERTKFDNATWEDNWEPKNYGCFDADGSNELSLTLQIGSEYCQTFVVNSTRAVYLGADVSLDERHPLYAPFTNHSHNDEFRENVFNFSLHSFNETDGSKGDFLGGCSAHWGGKHYAADANVTYPFRQGGEPLINRTHEAGSVMPFPEYDGNSTRINESGGWDVPPSNWYRDRGCQIDLPDARGRKTYLGCLQVPGNGDGDDYSKFRVPYESGSNSCGRVYHRSGRFHQGHDFGIYAREIQFSGQGNDTLRMEGKLLFDYLNKTYKGDCSQGCIFPVEFKAHESLRESLPMKIHDLNLSYESVSSPNEISDSYRETVLYDILPAPARITTGGYRRINLDGANFSLNGWNDKRGRFSLEIGGKKISGNVSVLKSSLSISNVTGPERIDFKIPTRFSANVTGASPSDSLTYVWNFGDGSPESRIRGKNSAEHVFNRSGNFVSRLTVRNSEGFSDSKTFAVLVETPKNTSAFLLAEGKTSLSNVTDRVNALPEFDKNSLKEFLNLSFVRGRLDGLQARHDGANGDAKVYEEVIDGLKSLEIPKKLVAKKGEFSDFVPDKRHVNLPALKEISGGDYDSSRSEEYGNLIDSWNRNEFTADLKKDEYYVEIERRSERKEMSVYVLLVRNSSGVSSHFILRDSGFPGLKFARDYDPVKGRGYTGIKLGPSNPNAEIKFRTEKNFGGFGALPVFISPSVKDLNLPSARGGGGGPNGNGWLIVLVLGVVLLSAGGVVFYVIVKRLYRKKYEQTLFEDHEDDLYNLVHYIGMAAERTGDVEIKKNLLEQGWKKAQINYAMRLHHDGRKDLNRAGGPDFKSPPSRTLSGR